MRQRELTKFLAFKYGKRSSRCHLIYIWRSFNKCSRAAQNALGATCGPRVVVCPPLAYTIVIHMLLSLLQCSSISSASWNSCYIFTSVIESYHLKFIRTALALASYIKMPVKGFWNWVTQEKFGGYSSHVFAPAYTKFLKTAYAYLLLPPMLYSKTFSMEINFTKAIILPIFVTKSNAFSNVLSYVLFQLKDLFRVTNVIKSNFAYVAFSFWGYV